MELAEARYAQLNVLVNNAGIVTWSAIYEMPVEEWDLVMAVNMRGVFLGIKHAIPAMIRAGGGSHALKSQGLRATYVQASLH